MLITHRTTTDYTPRRSIAEEPTVSSPIPAVSMTVTGSPFLRVSRFTTSIVPSVLLL